MCLVARGFEGIIVPKRLISKRRKEQHCHTEVWDMRGEKTSLSRRLKPLDRFFQFRRPQFDISCHGYDL